MFSDLQLDDPDESDDDVETSKNVSCSSTMSSLTDRSRIKTTYEALNYLIEHHLVPDEEAWFKLDSQKSK